MGNYVLGGKVLDELQNLFGEYFENNSLILVSHL